MARSPEAGEGGDAAQPTEPMDDTLEAWAIFLLGLLVIAWGVWILI